MVVPYQETDPAPGGIVILQTHNRRFIDLEEQSVVEICVLYVPEGSFLPEQPYRKELEEQVDRHAAEYQSQGSSVENLFFKSCPCRACTQTEIYSIVCERHQQKSCCLEHSREDDRNYGEDRTKEEVGRSECQQGSHPQKNKRCNEHAVDVEVGLQRGEEEHSKN